MMAKSGHYETNKSGWIRLHASVPSETKTVHKSSFINSTLSISINVYLWPSLSSLSNEVFFTALRSHWTTGSSVK